MRKHRLDHEVGGLLHVEHREPQSTERDPRDVRGGGPADRIRATLKHIACLADVDDRRAELIEDDADELALGVAESVDDRFHALVDVEADREDRDQRIGAIEQLAVGGGPGHRGTVEDRKLMAADGARLRDRLADPRRRLGVGRP